MPEAAAAAAAAAAETAQRAERSLDSMNGLHGPSLNPKHMNGYDILDALGTPFGSSAWLWHERPASQRAHRRLCMALRDFIAARDAYHRGGDISDLEMLARPPRRALPRLPERPRPR